MTHVTAQVASSLTRLLADSTPLQRWQAMRTPSGNNSLLPWMAGVVVALAAGAVAWWVVRNIARRRRQRRDWGEFYQHAANEGLSDEETQLLARLVREANLDKPVAIFSADYALKTGANGYLRSETFARESTEDRLRISQVLGSLRMKLQAGTARPDSDGGSRNILEGWRVKLLLMAEQASIRARVISCTPAELRLRPESPLTREPGHVLAVRFFDGRTLWEFDATVLRCEGGTLALSHSDRLRFLHRRRGTAVPMSRPAMVCPFDFHAQETRSAAPSFTEATLTQLAGAELKLRTALHLQRGEQVLLVLNVEDGKVFRCLGKVHATGDPRRLLGEYDVELVGLRSRELAELNAATARAAAEYRRQNQLADAAEAGRPGSAGSRGQWKASSDGRSVREVGQ